MKFLMLGNEAVARGAYEAGVRFASAYPGTPSTEITEYISSYDEVFSEWAPNEKVAVEAALGASLAGARSMSAMKHVGLNVAADPLFTASYTGVNAGFLICVADDPGMHSSQNEQDSRHYARASKTLMLEPSDSMECLYFTTRAFELSETFDTPVLLRLTTRVSHSRSLADQGARREFKRAYKRDPQKYVMMPAMAQKRHKFVEERVLALKAFAESTDLNAVEYNDKRIGVITSGMSYNYAKDALGDKASYLKLGVVYPLPETLITDFAANVDECYVLEELDPYIEEHCRALGLNVKGKAYFTALGEYSAKLIREVILNEPPEKTAGIPGLPGRPPVMCAGCPHRAVFYALKQIPGLIVSGDIGCYTLGALQPLNMMDSCVCMGASVSMAHGMDKTGSRAVAVIGDSTFIHSGVTGLIDIVYNKGSSTVIILDNSITGMTGHQNNPANGMTIKGEPTRQVDLKKLCNAVGVDRVFTVDPFDLKGFTKLVKTELEQNEPSVIIARRPCALLKTVSFGAPYVIDKEKCVKCGMCLKIGCPAIFKAADGKSAIDSTLCAGCAYCTNLCNFDSIIKGGGQA
ncbi:MAG: indolepyruvate ferredoxin oxidoreductase subunit alpha [Clostridiales bacterium]|jgi:indolepyruvate ferredoxin oxidoreductase alpha subunit|nr:indolepyruvate ferredoxin oxidoreductase subunit alpha [Clostridiales bacterium]